MNTNILFSQTIAVEKENLRYTVNSKMFMNRSTHSAWEVSIASEKKVNTYIESIFF